MIPQEQRVLAVNLIEEAVTAGARLEVSCEAVGIHSRTYNRWRCGDIVDRRKGSKKSVPKRLSDIERQEIVDICCKKEYQDLTPYEIFVILLDQKIYLASISTFYRVLRERGLVHFRGNTRKGVKAHRPPERVATGPNQVWAWDITYLKSPVAGIYYYLYTIIDVWSKKIVGWQVADIESYTISEQLFTRMMVRYKLSSVYLHSDNGNPMKSGTILMTLYKLGIVPSFSRPRVSNDNAFIESFFKTLKYMKAYPKSFLSMNEAQFWVADFIDWYNEHHMHSAIGYVTPVQKHSGIASAIIAARNDVKQKAYESNRHRWSGMCATLPDPQVVILNPSLERIEACAS